MKHPFLLLVATGVFAANLDVARTGSQTVALDTVAPGRPYSLVVSAKPPLASTLSVTLLSAGKTVVAKTLHAGDLDLTTGFQGAAGMQLKVAGQGAYRVQVQEVAAGTAVEMEPNNEPAEAQEYRLGENLQGSGDEAPYFPQPGQRGKPFETSPDWYRFDFDGKAPKLVYFWLEVMERDQVPVDVAVYRWEQGKAVLYTEGEDPVALPHEVQALAGNKFTTRVLRTAGRYLIRVVANHPEYRLRTSLYDPPPYRDPRVAVRTALDFLLGAGDSWHANTPRRGGRFDRVASLHQETSLCVACHPTHFTQRATLYAARNGYPVHMRSQLEFLSERFYNNPRPFYGFEDQGAVWARMISASANVLSRMSHLMALYESQITGEKRPEFHEGVKQYLKIYYDGRTQLPSDETNGNTPLVSTYEVAWYAWEVSKDPKLVTLLEQDEIKNMVDLCYQTLALASIDKDKYKDKIARNAERILSQQRESGQWAMRFDPKEPDVEFQTGHSLWALAAAGIPKENPKVKKGLDYLLGRQQDFGAWMDPLQSNENFRTPFRESQMAVLALSAYFPQTGQKVAWETPVIGPATPPAEVFARQAWMESRARAARPADLRILIEGLSDESKSVQRLAAWGVRQVYSRHADAPAAPLLQALASASERQRFAATRVFAAHFAALARRPEFAPALMRLAGDPSPAVQVQAIQGLWQFWFWTPSSDVKSAIEDTLLVQLAKADHPWVEENLRLAIYNVADENIRYLYNNWVPALAKAEDQERAIRGRLAIEERLAGKFAGVLESGTTIERTRLLQALVEFPLRRADIYEPKADLATIAPPVYNRIGNDIEQIVWFGPSAERFAKALIPLLDSEDANLRRLATEATLMLRDPKFGAVEKIAGEIGPLRDYLRMVLDQRQKDFPEVWRAFRPPQPVVSEAPRVPRVKVARPDESYFRGYVQPILEKRGKDGVGCVHCHATHTLFDGFSYGKALNVVDLVEPENSLILRKPTSTAESEGVVGAKQTAHGGGVRWEKGSPEYNTVLEWIRGAKP